MIVTKQLSILKDFEALRPGDKKDARFYRLLTSKELDFINERFKQNNY